MSIPCHSLVLSLALAVAGAPLALAAGPPLDLPSLTEAQVEAFSEQQSLASKAVSSKDWAKAARAYQKALRIHDGNDGAWYNLACAQALLGKTDDAMGSLKRALAAGWSDAAWPLKDTDLASLHALPEFTSWVSDVEARASVPPSPVAIAKDDLATSAAEVETLSEQADAKLQAVAATLGSAQQRRATDTIARWKVASFDAIAAAAPDAAARAEAEWSAIQALVRKDFSPRMPSTADDIAARADRFAAAHADSPNADSARLAAATARYRAEWSAEGEPSDAHEAAFERELLVIAATAAEGSAGLERALARLVSLTADDLEVARGFHGRLRRVVGDDKKFSELMLAEARGVHYRLSGLPEFTATTLGGEAFSPAGLRGKVTLVDFWATWCGPCRAELPHIKEAYSRFKDRGFEIVGVSLDKAKDGDATEFEAWCDENGVTWPQVFDGKHWEAALAKTFGVKSIPFPLLVGRDGRVVAADGQLRGEDLLEAIDAALSAPEM